ncbi:MAG TPA: hypothetical protein VNX68_09635 [Nitrosopumilaceae archaeon]|jgi:hypothetical protein|nr:hypothetical protein [Nitrosopumilaceae archaeon]
MKTKKIKSIGVSMAFVGAMFLFFTPYEDTVSNTMWPKYFAALVGSLFLAPILILKPLKLHSASLFIVFMLFAIITHLLLIHPISFQFDLLVMANCFLAILIFELSRVWKYEFEIALKGLLCANVIAIGVQAFMFFFGGGEIYDVYRFIFGSDSRFSSEYLNIARFSGMQVEPGTYANYISFLLAIFLLTSRFAQWKYIFSVLVILSILLTNSASAIFLSFAITLMLALVWGNYINKLHIVSLLVVVVLYFLFSNIVEHMHARFLENDDGSLSLRMTGLQSYLATSLESKVIGLGFGHEPCFECHYQDIGVIFNLVSSGGILLVFVIFIVAYRSLMLNGFWLAFVIFAIVSYSKMNFYETPVWLLFLFSMIKLRDRRNWREKFDFPVTENSSISGSFFDKKVV